MHALLASLGTDGDVYPYIGLGQRLRERGHRVTLFANERYRTWSHELGFGFEPLATEAETQQMLADPDLWHPWKCARVIARWGASMIGRQRDAILPFAQDPDALLVANPGVLAARILHEQLGTPLASVLLQPWIIPSITAPPVMLVTLPRWTPQFVGRAYWALFRGVAHQMIGKDVNRVRQSLGLPVLKNVFEWWLSPQLVLGLFPDWYGPPQADWSPQIRLTGFPLYDGRLKSGLPDDVREFLEAGEPPVAVTFGTGMMHAHRLLTEAVAACEQSGHRGMLLTRHTDQLPRHLPDSVRHIPFAPFRELFPQCAAVVHHGGVGTTSQCLAAGTPQLILPFAFDQPDNGVRVKRLGVGDWFHPGKRCASRIAKALTQLATPSVRERCAGIAQRFAGVDALTIAAEQIEAIAQAHPTNSPRETEARH
jgi:rhamnosyltransferase subunit B